MRRLLIDLKPDNQKLITWVHVNTSGADTIANDQFNQFKVSRGD